MKSDITFDSLLEKNQEFQEELKKYLDDKNLKPEDCKISINLSKNIKEYPVSFQKLKEHVNLLRNKFKLSLKKQ